MHFHPILFVQAENLEEEKIKARDFAECESGELFSQCFCSECTFFNIEYYDYSLIDEKGWYAIEADFHC
jgi:hypothetical protein